MRVLNVSNHPLSKEQRGMIRDFYRLPSVDVVNLPEDLKKRFSNLPPSEKEREELARAIVAWAKDTVGGTIYAHLDGEAHFVLILLSVFWEEVEDGEFFKFFSRRKVQETVLPSGEVRKVSIFRPVQILTYPIVRKENLGCGRHIPIRKRRRQ